MQSNRVNNLEIERKFLVKGDFMPFVSSSFDIAQGYLSSLPERTVRVRVKGDNGYLTIKGASSADGLTRFEWEKEISKAEALLLLPLCESGVISKTRYLIPIEGYTYEVDVFYGDNDGLVIAEIELNSENDSFIKPEWLGEEVTGIEQYYNAALSRHPYKQWNNNDKGRGQAT